MNILFFQWQTVLYYFIKISGMLQTYVEPCLIMNGRMALDPVQAPRYTRSFKKIAHFSKPHRCKTTAMLKTMDNA